MENITKEESYIDPTIIFSEISKILKNNNINETPEEAAFTDKSLIISVFKLLKQYLKKEITQENFILSLQNELKIDGSVASNMCKDIIQIIIPLLQPLASQLQTENKIIPQKKEIKISQEPKRKEITKKLDNEIPKKIIKKIDPDNYREQIE